MDNFICKGMYTCEAAERGCQQDDMTCMYYGLCDVCTADKSNCKSCVYNDFGEAVKDG